MVVANSFKGNQLIGTSRIPDNTDPCHPAGAGWIMALSPFLGKNPDQAFFDANGDKIVDDQDTVTVDGEEVPVAGLGFDTPPNAPNFVSDTMLVSFDDGTNAAIETSGTAAVGGRVSWRELVGQ